MILDEKELETLLCRILQEPPCRLHKRLYLNICPQCRQVICLECVDAPCGCFLDEAEGGVSVED